MSKTQKKIKKKSVETLPRIYRLSALLLMYGLSKSQIYNLITQNRFPKPVTLGGKRAVGWRAVDLQAWEDGLQEACNG